jgi:hypothetical protein
MHRNRTWAIDPEEFRTQRNRILPIEGGDGSTLTLDFTTGILDPRLSFERLSTATFINSSGLVAWAAANMMTRSQSQDVNAYWNAFGTSVTRTASQTDPFGGTGAVKLDYDPTLFDAVISRTVSVQQGLQYTISVWLRADSGTTSKIRLGRAASAAGAYFPTLTTTWQRFSLTFTATGGSDGIELRALTGPKASPVSFHVFGAQLEPGDTMRDYNPALLDVPYHAPRFDHDPTTLAPRGLLIEGQATNLARRSDDFNTSVTDGTQWTASGYTAGTLSTTLPDGTTGNARRISIASGSGSFRSATITVTASTAYTWSFWARNNGGSQARFRVWNVTAGSSIVDYSQSANNYVSQIGGANNTSSTWVRVSVSFTTPVGCTSIWVYPSSSDSGTVDLLIWGAQLEAGSGASSYIPTGASTATRNQDVCFMDTAEVNSWFIKNNEATFQAKYSCDNALSAGTNVFYLGQWSGVEYSYGYQHYTYAGSGNTLSANGKLVASPSRDLALYSNQSIPRAFNTAFSFSTSAGRIANSWNGNTPSQLSATSWPAWPGTVVRLGIGTSAISGTSSAAGFVRLLSLKYWPTALPDSTLQSLTT